jgi:uncharacterized protein YkwD
MHSTPAPRRRLAIAMPFALIAAIAVSVAAPVATGTTVSQAESSVIGWINAARSARGLTPLRYDSDLASISGIRAGRMASANTMTHTVGGNLASQLDSYGVNWYRYGENIGWSTASWPSTSAKGIFNAWMNSSAHRALILSSRFNYIGVGLAYRSSNRKTFSSIAVRRRHPLDVERVRPAAADPYRRTARFRCPVSRRLRHVATVAEQHDVDVALPVEPSQRVIRDPRASHRPAWQCWRMEQRVAYLGPLATHR